MPGTTDSSHRVDGESPGRWHRLGWFVLLYAAGFLVTLVVAYALRSLIPGAAG